MSDPRDTRYRGHLSLCEIDRPGQQRISSARVLVVGAGGLGSPVCLYLAAAGVGHITVLDPDTVSLSNLQRQVIHSTSDIDRPKAISARDTMTAINPLVTVEPVVDRLTPSNATALAGPCDLVIDCTDSLESRLLVNDTCVSLGKPYVFGAVRRFGGQVFTHLPGTATYRDIFGSSPAEGGDIPCAVDGVLNTVVGVVGCLQALSLIHI